MRTFVGWLFMVLGYLLLLNGIVGWPLLFFIPSMCILSYNIVQRRKRNL